ncbi:unnamed protein product [Litomosoides sigmodontis]|uniref:Uncharacterized protein n=1 Tax=Litomosoides sigmodontis TaxID=42156 RepID=A0A3P6U1W0_LITSI|nr:unnamed protein product [Litomosoides sigmodontis]
MLETDSTELPKEIVENELSSLSNNIASCLSAISLKVGSDKKTVGCVEECVIAAEELQTLGGLVKTDIRAVSESVAAISGQIEQLESLFQNIDRLEEFIKQTHGFPLFLLFCLCKYHTCAGLRLPEFIEIAESEDDTPVEVSSKIECEIPLTGNSSKSKKIKRKIRRRKKYKVIKLSEGVYKSETKTSTFKVIPLSIPPPQPSFNFRAQLLQKRTENQRLTKTEQAGLQHKNKWFAATRPACR